MKFSINVIFFLSFGWGWLMISKINMYLEFLLLLHTDSNISFHVLTSRFILSRNTVTIITSSFVCLSLSEGLTFQMSFRMKLLFILYAKMCPSRHIWEITHDKTKLLNTEKNLNCPVAPSHLYLFHTSNLSHTLGPQQKCRCSCL